MANNQEPLTYEWALPEYFLFRHSYLPRIKFDSLQWSHPQNSFYNNCTLHFNTIRYLYFKYICLEEILYGEAVLDPTSIRIFPDIVGKHLCMELKCPTTSFVCELIRSVSGLRNMDSGQTCRVVVSVAQNVKPPIRSFIQHAFGHSICKSSFQQLNDENDSN